MQQTKIAITTTITATKTAIKGKNRSTNKIKRMHKKNYLKIKNNKNDDKKLCE